jgi:hypothetical protein
MREHAHLPAMVGFVRKHVAEHFRANWPRPSPTVSVKFLDAAARAAERFSEHLRAASGALSQCRTGVLRRAVRTVELLWNLQVRSGKPDPLCADIVHMGEDGGDGASFAGRFGFPGDRVQTFDQHLVHALVGGKELDRGSGELRAELLSVNLAFACGHLVRLLDRMILPGAWPLWIKSRTSDKQRGKTTLARNAQDRRWRCMPSNRRPPVLMRS